VSRRRSKNCWSVEVCLGEEGSAVRVLDYVDIAFL
jgi:hypothetical protein